MDTFLHDAARGAVLELARGFSVAIYLWIGFGIAAVLWLAWDGLTRE